MKEIASSCKSSADFASLLNEATEKLMMRGDWPGTIIPIRVGCKSGCVVWPRFVQRVRRINNCRIPIKVSTVWGDFIDKQDYVGWCGANLYSWTGDGAAYRGLGQTLMQQHLGAQGRVPIFNDIPSDAPRYIRCYAKCKADVGKTVTIFGADANNQPLMTKQTDGTYTEGVVITLAIPYGSTSTYVSRIDAVLKDTTQLNVPMYCYEPVTNTLLQLADYAPDETNPSYAKDVLFAPGSCNCNDGQVTLLALVKLAFIPVSLDNDYVLIPSIPALKYAMQSVKMGEAGDAVQSRNFMQMAVDELNFVLENEQPLDQTPVDAGFGGGIQVGMQQLI
jgi:hypothetical protein